METELQFLECHGISNGNQKNEDVFMFFIRRLNISSNEWLFQYLKYSITSYSGHSNTRKKTFLTERLLEL